MEFDNLDKKFHQLLYAFIDQCTLNGIALSFDVGFVHPKQQAVLWRQSRSDSQIDDQINALDQEEAPYLAYLLRSVRAKPGVHVTDELPGFSWHNWGQAYTFSVLGEDGRDVPDNSNLYKKVAEIAKAINLESGYYFRPKKVGLVQLNAAKAPSSIYSLKEINHEMGKRYGNC